MLCGTIIEDLVALLTRRGVVLTHACQLLDFDTYLKLGGVPSRRLMERSGLPLTPFETDEIDKRNDVWDKIFLNPFDFGEAFAEGSKALPNTYGPIALIVRPEALLLARCVAVCLESAGSADFQPSSDILSSVQDVDRLFEIQGYVTVDTDAAIKSIRSLFEPTPARIKHRLHLAREFGRDHVSGPDIFCEVGSEILPLGYVSTVIVDPYMLKGQTLLDKVSVLVQEGRIGVQVMERPCANTTRREMYSQLAELVFGPPAPTENVVAAGPTSDPLLEFLHSLPKAEDVWKNQRPRRAKYLRSGTLEPLISGGAT